MDIEEITFEDSPQGQREAILKNIGKEVILKDGLQEWRHGTLHLGHDKQTYFLDLNTQRPINSLRLHYDDLIQLLVVKKY